MMFLVGTFRKIVKTNLDSAVLFSCSSAWRLSRVEYKLPERKPFLHNILGETVSSSAGSRLAIVWELNMVQMSIIIARVEQRSTDEIDLATREQMNCSKMNKTHRHLFYRIDERMMGSCLFLDKYATRLLRAILDVYPSRPISSKYRYYKITRCMKTQEHTLWPRAFFWFFNLL